MNRTDRWQQARRHVAAELSARAAQVRSSGAHKSIDPVAKHADESSTEELLLRAALKATSQGQIGRAVGIYRELLGINPSHTRARTGLAILLDQSGDREGALLELERALAVNPEDPAVLLQRGAIRGAAGQYAAAEQDVRAVLRAHSANADAHHQLGVLLSRKGLWRDAVAYLRRAVELDPSCAEAYYYLGEALNHVDDLGGALQCFQRAMELRPNDSKTLYGMGIVLDRLSRPDEAAQMYRRSRDLTHR